MFTGSYVSAHLLAAVQLSLLRAVKHWQGQLLAGDNLREHSQHVLNATNKEFGARRLYMLSAQLHAKAIEKVVRCWAEGKRMCVYESAVQAVQLSNMQEKRLEGHWLAFKCLIATLRAVGIHRSAVAAGCAVGEWYGNHARAVRDSKVAGVDVASILVKYSSHALVLCRMEVKQCLELLEEKRRVQTYAHTQEEPTAHSEDAIQQQLSAVLGSARACVSAWRANVQGDLRAIHTTIKLLGLHTSRRMRALHEYLVRISVNVWRGHLCLQAELVQTAHHAAQRAKQVQSDLESMCIERLAQRSVAAEDENAVLVMKSKAQQVEVATIAEQLHATQQQLEALKQSKEDVEAHARDLDAVCAQQRQAQAKSEKHHKWEMEVFQEEIQQLKAELATSKRQKESYRHEVNRLEAHKAETVPFEQRKLDKMGLASKSQEPKVDDVDVSGVAKAMRTAHQKLGTDSPGSEKKPARGARTNPRKSLNDMLLLARSM
eukprot:TRINITY_DN6142_c0_g1_i4.p1 TRINITY_DN6142_c0_g1~~TRINITY_DN6142_c0_g1_i4.p1  ORF type:complete len:488 (+),score=120.32 TRINITY_DN6142_c0_g1_i4:740-2203(+)